MNNNICQFYIILGIKNFNYPKNNDVYINATNIKDLNELSKCILDSYKEKAKLGNKVLGEIIFIIPDEKYTTKTQEIINKLKVNGKIKVLPKTTTEEKKVQTNNIEQKPNPKPEIKPQEEKIEQQKPKVSIYQPEKNIYKSNYDNKTYTNLNKSKESNKKAIILFIISFIFFIIALILSFFM